MTLLPAFVNEMTTSHKNRRLSGSIPVVGSSNMITFGSPTNAIAVDNFLFVPPLYVNASALAYLIRSSFSSAQSIT